MTDITPRLHIGDLHAMVATELFGLSKSVDSSVGLELEMFAVTMASNGICRNVELNGSAGLRDWMSSLATAEGWEYDHGDAVDPRIFLPGGGAITLEPAGQIEYSGPPAGSCTLALDDLERVEQILARSAAEHGVELIIRGFNSDVPEHEQELVVGKMRYRLMDQYFATIGPFGRRMMRSTCALQINLDFGSPAETPGRWRLANMIAPSLNAIFANSPAVVGGKRYRSYRHEIWRHADRSRTGRLYDSPDLDPVADYLSFALNAGVIFMQEPGGELVAPPRPMTFADWISGTTELSPPGMDDWRRHLSTLFPDVRARGYIELRSIDALPSPKRDVAVAMVSTLIYTASLREQAIARLEKRQRLVDPLEIEHGGCWQSDYQTGRELLELAIPGIADSRLQRLAEKYLEGVIVSGLTPGEIYGGEVLRGYPLGDA